MKHEETESAPRWVRWWTRGRSPDPEKYIDGRLPKFVVPNMSVKERADRPDQLRQQLIQGICL